MAVAVVERFKQELMYGLSAGARKSGRCREVAVSGGSTVVSALLRNALTGLYGNQTSNFFFQLDRPSLEDYFS